MWFRLFSLTVVVFLTLAQGNQKYYKRLQNIQYVPFEEAFGRQRSEQNRVYGGGYQNPFPYPQTGMRTWGNNGQSTAGYNGWSNLGYNGQSNMSYGQSNVSAGGLQNGDGGQSNVSAGGLQNGDGGRANFSHMPM
ncbi:unnamed protein product [Cylicocyclus nassatus]|uniref:Uncharacterized protein n=1 Tax=Cylicocyclus nassatus TaxID=53992 RepID=A0AA36GUD3_CYLNA|nr:unnamed protein product [Cylicocyclus nassatus]